jgi:hypothetical protein
MQQSQIVDLQNATGSPTSDSNITLYLKQKNQAIINQGPKRDLSVKKPEVKKNLWHCHFIGAAS